MTDHSSTPKGRNQNDSSRGESFPRARSRRLLVEELDGETLVYDLDNHEAHCLNRAAALVWDRSNGATSVEALADLLPEAGLPRDVDLVWLTLDRLDRAGLLLEPEPPAPRKMVTRREVLRALGATAGLTLLLPAVDSVVAPLAAQAASCLTNSECRSQAPPNCTGLPICNSNTKCCTEVVSRKGSQCNPVTC
jgi:hypothetical protein